MKQTKRLDCWQDWRALWLTDPSEGTCLSFLHWLCRQVERAGELQLSSEQCEQILLKADKDCQEFSRSITWHSERLPSVATIGPKAFRTFIPQLIENEEALTQVKSYYDSLGWSMEEEGDFEGEEVEVGILINREKRLEIHGV